LRLTLLFGFQTTYIGKNFWRYPLFKKILFACLLFAAFPAHAQLSLNPNEPPKVKAELIAEDDGIAPGKTVWVALKQEITPGWHTYWSNPGDTGLATTLSWTLPQGFTATDLQFPTPHKEPTGELVNYGYQDSVIIPVQITAPATAKTGDTVELKAHATWLVCKDICVPENTDLSLKLKIADKPLPSPWASAFIAAKDRLPKANPAQQTAKINGDNIEVTINPIPLDASELPEEAYFYPHDGLLIMHNSPQKMDMAGRSLTLTIPRNKTRTTPIDEISGDIWLRTMTGEKSFQFKAKVEQLKPVAAIPASPVSEPGSPKVGINQDKSRPLETPDLRGAASGDAALGFFGAVFFALLGGILLNLMPCVFPVLSLKALGLVQKAHHEKHRSVVMGGMAYLAGVLATFTLLGLVIITLKSAGAQIGWGVQLQSPVFVSALALLLFFIGYSLSGAVTIGTRLMGVGNSLTQKSSIAGSFFTGALAVVVATPCTAPFMGGAIFYALTQPAIITLLVLWALGFGLALPYVLLTLFPELLLKYLPKPGIWMEHFKQFLAFPMLAASIWLVWVLSMQNGATGVLYVLFAMLFLAFALWLWKTTQNRPTSLWQYFKIILALVTGVLSISLILMQPKAIPVMAQHGESFESYTPQKLSDARAAKKPVFVNMTAAWCITCLANEKAALEKDSVKKYFADHNILFLKGDWTNYDPAITSYLKEFNRSGVPIYVFYPSDQSAPIVLPQILTPDTVIDILKPTLGEK
jgi:thiol:disulfide interchange protein